MTDEAMAATEKCGALQQRHIPCDGRKALVSKPLFGRKLGPALGKWRLQRQGKPILANISHCPHYPQSRASIVPQLIFLHCGKIAPLGLLCTSAKQPFGSGFIVVQFLYQGGTEMMVSALFAVEKSGRGRSSRKGPICTNLVCRHGTRVRPKTNNQFGAGTLRHQCAHLYSVC
jgi:hypothetical protein